jgi:hypothetical protein
MDKLPAADDAGATAVVEEELVRQRNQKGDIRDDDADEQHI